MKIARNFIRQLKIGYGCAATRSEMDEFGRKNFRSP